MLPIGEFSKLCGVSTKTLRYYNEIGLLLPQNINPENGYRYYSTQQLKDMLWINRLKSFHCSLEEIKSILEQGSETLEEVLLHKQRELLEKQRELSYTLLQLGQDIGKVKEGIPIMAYVDDIVVELVHTESMELLSIRRMMSSADYAQGYKRYFDQLYARAAREGLNLRGAPMTFYHSDQFDPAGNDTEFALPISVPVVGSRTLPRRSCAKAVYTGAYADLPAVYARMWDWAEQQGYALVDSPYEIYLTDPAHSAADQLVTEVYFPVKLNLSRS